MHVQMLHFSEIKYLF